MNSRQRAYLSSLANTMDPIFNIGKASLTPEIIEAASLKETNLLTFAKQLNMTDPYGFTDKFIHDDRVARLF